jgi:YidC/Oxa1 family membrane protein insertase
LEKKTTIIAVVAATAIMLVWLLLINPLTTGNKGKAPTATATAAAASASPAAPLPTLAADAPTAQVVTPAAALDAKATQHAAALSAPALPAVSAPDVEQSFNISTDLVDAVFTNRGGELTSLKLKKHLDKGKPVEMILGGADGSYAFGMSFGDFATAIPKDLMNCRQIDDHTLEFSRVYFAPGASGELIPFTLKKQFTLKPGEYMFELKVTIENSINAVPSLNAGGYAYTLFFGPQIGPKYEKLSQYSETRSYSTFANGKKKKVGLKPNSVITVKDHVLWASIVGKYFSFVAIPDATPYSVIYNSNSMPGVPNVSQISLSRPPVASSVSVDTFRFYIGPNVPAELERYNNPAKNSFAYNDLKINQIIDTSGFFTWFENILKWIMGLFVRLIPNWGVSIILLTILVKVLLFPLTLKGTISQAKMADIQPKMQEIQAKYKDKPEKLNQATMELYKQEGYNPLSGCLPLLIQLPIFWAMYQLFNTQFDLRNAMFIPGWIVDLSQPDSVFHFKEINLLIWRISDIRVLPIIYVISQLLYGRYTQSTQSSASNPQMATQMKFMMYGFPIIFFFVLYDAPAGLLVYWIASNVLTIAQQIVTNRIVKAQKKNQPVAQTVKAKTIPTKNKKKRR